MFIRGAGGSSRVSGDVPGKGKIIRPDVNCGLEITFHAEGMAHRSPIISSRASGDVSEKAVSIMDNKALISGKTLNDLSAGKCINNGFPHVSGGVSGSGATHPSPVLGSSRVSGDVSGKGKIVRPEVKCGLEISVHAEGMAHRSPIISSRASGGVSHSECRRNMDGARP